MPWPEELEPRPEGGAGEVEFFNVVSELESGTTLLLVPETGDGLISVERTDVPRLAIRPAARFLRGDANGNGSVEVSEGVFALRFLFLGGPAPWCLDAAHADDSGRLAMTDPIRILRFLFLGAPAPPPPGPFVPATDPTVDRLSCGHRASGTP